MPVLVVAPPVFTAEQETRLREIFREEIQTWYTTAIPGARDRDGKPYTRYQADLRGVYAYDIGRDGGLLEKRADALEAALAANGIEDDALTAAVADMSAVVAEIRAALAQPILP
jgi:hypothetical protein